MKKANGKKPAAPAPGAAPAPEWDPSLKESWHLDFEKEPINDDKWSCIVTAAVPAEAADDECIQYYTQCVNTGLRKAVKIISMTDVVALLKGSTSVADNQKIKPDKTKADKTDRVENVERGVFKPPTPRFNEIVGLAAKYASFTDLECKLPSDLMAAVLKYLILTLKDENCFQKRVEAVKARKMKEKVLKAKFIRSLKPYEISQEERQPFKVPPNFLDLEEPIHDQPFNGPDLYILLTDIYDLFCFPELVRLKVPFVALLRVVCETERAQGKSSFIFPSRTDSRKIVLISEFWESLRENCIDREKTKKFKDIAMLNYETPLSRNLRSKNQYLLKIFNELTGLQYSVYNIHRQHQMYLRELYVQRLIMSIEPLDLERCEVYNKICDILITGQLLTPVTILYAIIEQVVAGVPETGSVTLEYKPESTSFDFRESTRSISRSQSGSVGPEDLKHAEETLTQFTTPCNECRDKIGKTPCDKLKNAFTLSVKNSRMNSSEEALESPSQVKEYPPKTSIEEFRSKMFISTEFEISGILNEVLAERKAEDLKKDKKWKAPIVCFHGDNVSLQMYHCNPRIITPEILVNRFLKSAQVSKVWAKYPELTPEERAFLNFHFLSLQKISKECEESLKVKIHFLMIMRLLGTVRSYLYRGLEKSLSEAVFFWEREKKLSKVKFEKNTWGGKQDDKNFSNAFFRTFVAEKTFRRSRRHINTSDEDRKNLLLRLIGSESFHKNKTSSSTAFLSHPSSGMRVYYRPSDVISQLESGSTVETYHHSKLLSSLLDLPEISSLNDPHFLSNKNEYLQLIQSFKYYETLDPHVMIQRLLQAEENYNSIQYSYFTPTDTVMVVMFNDFDHRGVFYTRGTGVVPTPLALRDFYNYEHNNIRDWLFDEKEAYMEFISSLKDKAEAEEGKKDEEFLTQLKREYCEMNPERRKEFLETVVDLQTEPEVKEEELGDLPIKPKFAPPRKVSFVVTNLADIRVQCKRKLNGFYSRDGLEVNAITDMWLYEPFSLLTLVIKRKKLWLYYNQWLGDDIVNTAFTFKTTSEIVFAFYKDSAEETEDFNYNVNVAWPTGLRVQPVFTDSGLYIKQGYLADYRSGLDVEEKSRCYIKNGQVLVMKKNGDFDILCGNGTKYIFYESAAVPRYEIVSTTGEIWEVRTKGPCRFRRKLRTTQKIYIGTDSTTQEIYYRREDGVNCMLWPNGRLVTTYSDGTKITSTPYFDEEVAVEWSEEEKLYFMKVESNMKVPELSSRATLWNFSGPGISESNSFTVEAFVSISCSYLMEHPKYTTVFFNPEEPFVALTMPENLRLLLYPGGNYEVRQEMHVLTVQGNIVEFYATCDNCDNRSGATMDFSDQEILCEAVDFFQKGFLVNRKGNIMYQDNKDRDGTEHCEGAKSSSKISEDQCINQHTKRPVGKQRCFALNRDLSGVEFFDVISFALDCYELPDDTYFDLHTDVPPKISHTFSSPYYKIGYENWVMDYEDKDNSLPTNLRKKDLKELGVKENPANFFKYPFPKHHNRSTLLLPPRPQKQASMPKVTVVRMVKCLSPEPNSIIESMHAYIGTYQKRVHEIFTEFRDKKVKEEISKEERLIQMKLRKIALTLNQSLKMYPHLCIQSPSTEKDIHYFGHFIQLMEKFKSPMKDEQDPRHDCKQIPKPLPKSSIFPAIREESEPI